MPSWGFGSLLVFCCHRQCGSEQPQPEALCISEHVWWGVLELGFSGGAVCHLTVSSLVSFPFSPFLSLPLHHPLPHGPLLPSGVILLTSGFRSLPPGRRPPVYILFSWRVVVMCVGSHCQRGLLFHPPAASLPGTLQPWSVETRLALLGALCLRPHFRVLRPQLAPQ